MKWLITVLLIIKLGLCQRAESPNNDYSLLGYWETDIVENGKQSNWLCEINDSTFTYWHEDINFLTPRVYSIVNGKLFFMEKNTRNHLDSSLVGEIQFLKQDSFLVSRLNNNYSFKRIDKYSFDQKTNGFY
ncbi:MAG: hypothetical protein R2795_00535 [Saprospiraceae bacterium]